MNDGFDTKCHVFCRIAVVGANHQHHQLRLNPFQFTVTQAPDDVLRAIAADTEIGGFQRRKIFIPDGFTFSTPAIRDRVTSKEQVHVTSFGDREEPVMPPTILFFGNSGSWPFARIDCLGKSPHQAHGQESQPPWLNKAQ